MDWSPVGDRIVTAGLDGTARVWDVSERAQIIAAHPRQPLAYGREYLPAGYMDYVKVAWSPDGNQLASASLDGTLGIWNPASGEAILSMTATGPLSGIEWSASGEQIITPGFFDPIMAAFNHPQILVWDAASGEQVRTIPAEVKVGFSRAPADDRIFSGISGGQGQIWDAATGKTLVILEGHSDGDSDRVLSGDWSPDGTRVVTSGDFGHAYIWDVATGQQLMDLDTGNDIQISAVAWSPDGSKVATYGLDTVGGRIWDAATGEVLITFKGHSALVAGLDWSPSGDRLLSTSDDGTAVIWEPRLGVPLLTYTFPTGLGPGRWSPDGQHFAMGGDNGNVMIVEIPWQNRDELIAYARQYRFVQPLTERERTLFGLPPVSVSESAGVPQASIMLVVIAGLAVIPAGRFLVLSTRSQSSSKGRRSQS